MQLLTINGAQFRFSTTEEIVRTKAALSATALQGGGFVEVNVDDGTRAVSVFVSPSSAIFAEEEPATVAAGASAHASEYPFWLDEL
jgi:hypothetical protein